MFPSPKLNLFICENFIDVGRKIKPIKAYLSAFQKFLLSWPLGVEQAQWCGEEKLPLVSLVCPGCRGSWVRQGTLSVKYSTLHLSIL